jgi:hypothetical protein
MIVHVLAGALIWSVVGAAEPETQVVPSDELWLCRGDAGTYRMRIEEFKVTGRNEETSITYFNARVVYPDGAPLGSRGRPFTADVTQADDRPEERGYDISDGARFIPYDGGRSLRYYERHTGFQIDCTRQ